MLVHKKTMGILEYIWAGDYQRTPKWEPKFIPATAVSLMRLYPDFNPDEYWQVSNNSSLARVIRKYYPALTPITDASGELVSVKILHENTDKADTVAQASKVHRGYGCVNALPELRVLLAQENADSTERKNKIVTHSAER